MTQVINLFGGPGTGKSTVAADLFAEMKWQEFNVELVSEYAKLKTWEGHRNVLEDQLYITAKQNRKLEPLVGKVDYVITDSPLLICIPYIPASYKQSFQTMVLDMYARYNNVNIFLNRLKTYSPIGRSQTLDEARVIDMKLKMLLGQHGLPYTVVDADRDAKHKILEILK